MRWINSAGGPLVLVSEDNLPSWLGVQGLSTAIGGDPGDSLPRESDYDRACSVRGYAGVIGVGTGQALVFGDEPLQTTWIPSHGIEGGVFARWVFANDQAQVAQLLSRIPDDLFKATDTAFHVVAERWVLFDAAIAGPSVSERDCLRVNLAGGHYQLGMAIWDPDSTTQLLLHQLRRDR